MGDFISIKYKNFCHFIDIIYRYNYIFANPSLEYIIYKILKDKVKCQNIRLTLECANDDY